MKIAEAELAILGGTPAFPEPLHVGRPTIGDRTRLLDRIHGLLDRGWLTNGGPLVDEFEQRIAGYVGVKHCIAMCNATAALEITTRALGMHGEVILPALTFVATAHALQWQGVTPVFCDVDPQTQCLDPSRVESMITPRTTGIVGVHLWGRPCDTERLERIARAHHLSICYDAAHAFGCSHQGRRIGCFGDAEVLSFHATKFVNAFEGGAVLTDNDALATKIRLMKNFGFAGQDHVIHVGINGKMSEVSAAMGLTSIEAAPATMAANRDNYHEYRRQLADVPGVRLIRYDETEECNYQYVVLDVDADEMGLSRDQMICVLRAEGVLARRYFYPGCHRMAPYREYFPHAGLLLPVTEALVARVINLPTGPSINREAIGKIATIMRTATLHGAELARRIESTRPLTRSEQGDPVGLNATERRSDLHQYRAR